MRSSLMILLLPLAAACGGGSDSNGQPLPATLKNVETEVFAKSCSLASQCHKGANPPAGLSLVSPAHHNLVGVASTEKPSKLRVKPGDPDGSFLLDKVLGKDIPTSTVAGVTWSRMPPNAPMLEEDRIELIRAWIQAGALDD